MRTSEEQAEKKRKEKEQLVKWYRQTTELIFNKVQFFSHGRILKEQTINARFKIRGSYLTLAIKKLTGRSSLDKIIPDYIYDSLDDRKKLANFIPWENFALIRHIILC